MIRLRQILIVIIILADVLFAYRIFCIHYQFLSPLIPYEFIWKQCYLMIVMIAVSVVCIVWSIKTFQKSRIKLSLLILSIVFLLQLICPIN